MATIKDTFNLIKNWVKKNIPTKVSDLQNDSQFITATVNNLANYYKKNETYTQAEIDAKLSAIPKFSIEVVEELPTSDISETTVYLVPEKDAKSPNMYTEYIYAKGAWEMLGTQSVDLTGYVKSEAISDMLTKTEANNTYLGKSASASSATKLANSRTLWGQSFNGTQDVKGNMSGVGSLAMNGVLSGARGEIREVGNQQANSDFRGAIPSGWSAQGGATMAYDATEGAIVLTKDSTATYAHIRTMESPIPIEGHRYIMMSRCKASINRLLVGYYEYNRIGNSNRTSKTLVATDRYTNTAMIASGTGSRYWAIVEAMMDDASQVAEGVKLWIKWCQAIDLTQMFGEGNEPTTATEFANRLGYASIDDVPYIPYTEEPIELNNAMAIGGDLVVNGTPLKGDMIATKTQIEATSETTKALEVGKVVNFGEVTTLNISLAEPTQTDVVNEYGFVFTAGVSNMTYTMPTSVKWEVGKGAPTITAGHTYEVSIIDNCATYLEFA